jgi:RNA polymerase sigma-70 factor (ECF subfamily)
MDTSIRFYTTNSRWGSSTEDESQGHSAIPLSADEHRCEGVVDKEEEHPETSLSETSTITQPEQVNIADFESIFLRYQGPITNFIYHLLGNREQACDLAQDVFVKAYKALL